MATNQLKILLVGPVSGQLTHLSSKLSTLQNSKAGPFDICICTGPFFHKNNEIPSFVMPVVFVDEGDGIPQGLSADTSEGALNVEGMNCISTNLYHLPNQADIIALPLPKRPSVTIGYCRPNTRLNSSCDVFQSKAKHTSFLGCDVFISSEWGQGIETLVGEQEEGSYDVAELVAMCRPRYHLAPGLTVVGEDGVALHKFVASPPYRYSSNISSHAGRFLALGHVTSPAEAKSLGKAYKYVHAIGITPLAYMNETDRERAREEGAAVANPYTDDSYKVEAAVVKNGAVSGGISEAQARRLVQQHANSQEDHRWQSRKRKHEETDAMQLEQENNPNNMSLFLHGLHRDAAGYLTEEVLMDAFRPFGCHTVRYPRSGGVSSFVFLDFNSHEEALQCLKKVKGEVAIRNVMLTLKWSNPTNNPRRGDGDIPPPPPKRKQRLTEAEASDSSTLFLKLPPTVDVASYAIELETVRMLAERTMEDELNIGIPADSPDRITAANEPALKVAVRQPDSEKGYGFLQFNSHTAALTTLVSLTGNEDGGMVNGEKLAVDLTNGDGKSNASHLVGISLYWAKDSQPKTDADAKARSLGQRTDCWFCLASPTCEKHLIVAVHEDCYIAMPKGAINDHHALIVPIDHKHQGALVDSKLSPEIDEIKAKLRLHAKKELNKDLFVFERCIQTKGGYHTHVQCIPVDEGSGPALQSKMMEMAIRNNFKLKEITSDLGLPALGGEWDDGYFYAEIPLPGGEGFRRFVYNAGENEGTVPLQFGREVVAAVMGDEKVGQWKACLVSQEKEEELTVAFRKSYESIT